MKSNLFLTLLFLLLVKSQCPQKLGKCYIFPPSDEWNRPINQDPIDFMSSCYISSLQGAGTYVRLDMGDASYPYYGIPYDIVDNPPLTPISFGVGGESYPDESDCYDKNGKFTSPCSNLPNGQQYFPFPSSVVVEGDGDPTNPGNTRGDRHAIVIDNSKCMIYESYATVRPVQTGSFMVASTAIYNMSKILPQRPDGWTSADAAGLPIVAGLLKYEEVQSGAINHALRFTTDLAQNAYVHPAIHFGPHNNFTTLPYGTRLRLRSSWSESQYTSNQSKIFVQALKKYGLMFADQGSSFYVTGTASPNWDDTFFNEMNLGSMRIPISQFDIVQSPFTVVYGWQATPTCNSKTSNPTPYVTNYNPVCPDFSSNNVVETTQFAVSNSSYDLFINIMFIFILLLIK